MDEALASPAFSDVVALAVDNAADRMDAYTHVTDDIGTGAIGGGAGHLGRLHRLREPAAGRLGPRMGARGSPRRLAVGRMGHRVVGEDPKTRKFFAEKAGLVRPFVHVSRAGSAVAPLHGDLVLALEQHAERRREELAFEQVLSLIHI